MRGIDMENSLRFDMSSEEVKIERLNPFDVIDILKEKGIVIGDVIMNSEKYIRVCHILGVKPPLVL